MVAPFTKEEANASSSEMREQLMCLADHFINRMAPGANALNCRLIADQAGPSGQVEAGPVDLDARCGIYIEIDQTRRRAGRFKGDTAAFSGNGVHVEPHDRARAESIPNDRRCHQIGEAAAQLAKHPEKNRRRTRRRFFCAWNI